MNTDTRSASALLTDFLGFVAGAIIGALSAVYATRSARAAVRLRPKLADIGFLDAVLAGHGSDWLFYHHPVWGSIINIWFAAVVVGVLWLAQR